MKGISDRNPDLDEMEERGWAWIQRSGPAHGAPYTDDEYASDAVSRLHPDDETDGAKNHPRGELLIVSWEDN